MAYLIEVPVEGGGHLVVQASDEDLPGELVLAARPGEIAARTGQSLEHALDQPKPAVRAIRGRLAAMAPDQVTVEFGIVLGAETGVIVAKGTTEVPSRSASPGTGRRRTSSPASPAPPPGRPTRRTAMPDADRPSRVGEDDPEPSGGPQRFLVRFSGPSGAPVGVGLLVGESEILTCAHVVNAALGLDSRTQAEPTDPVTVDFPLLPSPSGAAPPSRRARVVRWIPPPRERSAGDDIAGLELLDGPAPAGARPAKLVVNLPAV